MISTMTADDEITATVVVNKPEEVEGDSVRDCTQPTPNLATVTIIIIIIIIIIILVNV